MRLYEKLKKPKFILQGVATYLPNTFRPLLPKHQPQFLGQGVRTGADNEWSKIISLDRAARSCYAAWLRTIVAAHKHGLPVGFNTVAEIGPGDSLGVGICALLSGARQYFALDIMRAALNLSNLDIFEKLVKLFKERSPIPDDKEMAKCRPRLASYEFPSYILTEKILNKALADDRIAKIRQAILDVENPKDDGEVVIKYMAPWEDEAVIRPGTVDIILSHAVMEHVDDIDKSYRASYLWLKRGGYIAHAIDYKCHATNGLWNGHWTYSDFIWKIIRGKSFYFINREPHSAHIVAIKQNGFKIILADKYKRSNSLTKRELATKFGQLSDEDLEIAESFIIAQKI